MLANAQKLTRRDSYRLSYKSRWMRQDAKRKRLNAKGRRKKSVRSSDSKRSVINSKRPSEEKRKTNERRRMMRGKLMLI